MYNGLLEKDCVYFLKFEIKDVEQAKIWLETNGLFPFSEDNKNTGIRTYSLGWKDWEDAFNQVVKKVDELK
jgi:ABC-type glycerol-3-phosphate transport system substrate-binding protein